MWEVEEEVEDDGQKEVRNNWLMEAISMHWVAPLSLIIDSNEYEKLLASFVVKGEE